MNKPQRTCVGCRKVLNKEDLIRIVKNGSEIDIDETNKKDGRGAYIHNDIECIKKVIKTKALNRTFKCNVSDKVYESLKEKFVD